MNSMAISLITFALVFGGALLGMSVRAALPKDHLTAESKDAVKVGMGLVATMAALVLGLLVASAKAAYDAQSTEVTEMSANIVVLDRVLAHYAPETNEARDLLRGAVARVIAVMWPKGGTRPSDSAPRAAGGRNSLRQNTGTGAKGRCAALAPGPGTQPGDESRTNAVVDVRTGCHIDIHAVAHCAGFLADRSFHQLRPFCPSQRNRCRQPVHLRTFS